MSTLQLNLNLSGSVKGLDSAKTGSDGKLSGEEGINGESGPLNLRSTAAPLDGSPFVSMVHGILADGNSLPDTGLELPLETAELMRRWSGEQAGSLVRAIEDAWSTAGELQPGGDPISGGPGGKFALSPLAQVLNRLQSRKELLAAIDPAAATLGGQSVDGATPALNQGASAVAPLNRLSDLPTGSRPTFSLDAPFGQEKWVDTLGERATLMLKGNQQVAHLRLDPPHLGPLELRVALNQDQASVAFVAQHAVVREALEQAIPRLRELLGQQDLQLVDVNVSQGELAGGRGDGEAAPGTNAHNAGVNGAAGGLEDTTVQQVGPQYARGLVDLFA